MLKQVFGLVCLATCTFSAAATTPPANIWTKVQHDKGMLLVNRNEEQHFLTVNCKKDEFVWVSLEVPDGGYLMTPDPDGDKTGFSKLELLVTQPDGTMRLWTTNDLKFNAPNGEGEKKVKAFFNAMHTAKEVDALVDDFFVEKFHGKPSDVFPEFNEVKQICGV